MHVLASALPGSAWTFGGSVLTFAFPTTAGEATPTEDAANEDAE